MCRYAMSGPYKEPFACFDCRKVFKQTNRFELPEEIRPPVGEPRLCKCPQCGQPMADMGHDFKAPKQKDVKQWLKVKILFEHGISFHSCGCCGPGFRPEELKDVHTFIEGRYRRSEGELLLEKILSRVKNK